MVGIGIFSCSILATLRNPLTYDMWVEMAILPAGSDIRRISNPLGSVSDTNLYPRVLSVPDS